MLPYISLETMAKLAQDIENQEKIEFLQQQYFSPMYTQAWYQTQVVRQTLKWLEYSFMAIDIMIIPLILLMIMLSFGVYVFAPLHRFLFRKPPKNSRVQFDLSKREIMIVHENQKVETIELGVASSLMYEYRPLCLSRDNKLILLNVYDKNGKAHLILEMETATLFGKSDPILLKQVDDLLDNLAKKIQLKLFFDKTGI